MKILFISSLFPYPLHSGGQVRMYNLLRELSQQHEITLFSFIRSEEEKQYLPHLSFCARVRTFFRGRVWQPKYVGNALIHTYPLLSASYDQKAMRQAIVEELKRISYDCIHIEPFYVYPVLPPSDIPLVVSEHNIEYQVYEHLAKHLPTTLVQMAGAWDAKKMRIYEESVWKQAKAITAVSKPDAVHIGKRVGDHKVTVVPNGIDPSYFSYTERPFDRAHPTFLFVGNFSWKPNEDALHILMKRYWPRILQSYPNATLTVCGQHLSQTLLHALQQTHVVYKERVEDIRDLYGMHDVLLAPFAYGGGTKFKILEAMASGALVITTKAGIEGIEAEDQKECLIATDDASFLSLVSFTYSNPVKALSMTKRARKLVEKTYNWKTIAGVLDTVWRASV